MKTAIAIALAAILTGCASSRPWEGRIPNNCEDQANKAVRVASENNHLTGVVICTPRRAMARHAVTWVIYEGELELYDAAMGRRVTARELGTVHHVTLGPSRGSFDLIPTMILDGNTDSLLAWVSNELNGSP